MTTKTLGQVLYEAEVAAYAMYVTAKPWVELVESRKQDYETAAQAVAAVVREQVAAWIEPQRNDVPATGAEFAAAIRSMKP